MENNLILLSPVIAFCCLGAILTPVENLRQKAEMSIEYALLHGALAISAVVIPIEVSVSMDRLSPKRFSEILAIALDPVLNAKTFAEAYRVPVEAITYNPFYWLSIAGSRVFFFACVLFLVISVCCWATLGSKIFFKKDWSN